VLKAATWVGIEVHITVGRVIDGGGVAIKRIRTVRRVAAPGGVLLSAFTLLAVLLAPLALLSSAS
jgi:hypothetical protein